MSRYDCFYGPGRMRREAAVDLLDSSLPVFE
jgi:hypothetical protein